MHIRCVLTLALLLLRITACISKIKEAYLEGDLATKRTILKCIGSEFIVKDKQFFIKLEPVFEVRIKNSFGVLMEYGIF